MAVAIMSCISLAVCGPVSFTRDARITSDAWAKDKMPAGRANGPLVTTGEGCVPVSRAVAFHM
ncbi:hypothetical protein [Streptomyces lavendulae]|uniref:hypothetical protein n=1 Tax=Streptomyces lavendulae TaxID=1914 RepID=UPI0031E55985